MMRLLRMLSGPLIWFSHFSLIYAAAGFGGALGFSEPEIRLFCRAATILAIAAVAFLLWAARGKRAATASMGRSLARLSLVAILFQALVLWIVPF